MITQTSIHLKLDSVLLQRLDSILDVANVNRNKAINLILASVVKCLELQLEVSKGKSVHFFNEYGYGHTRAQI